MGASVLDRDGDCQTHRSVFAGRGFRLGQIAIGGMPKNAEVPVHKQNRVIRDLRGGFREDHGHRDRPGDALDARGFGRDVHGMIRGRLQGHVSRGGDGAADGDDGMGDGHPGRPAEQERLRRGSGGTRVTAGLGSEIPGGDLRTGLNVYHRRRFYVRHRRLEGEQPLQDASQRV